MEVVVLGIGTLALIDRSPVVDGVVVVVVVVVVRNAPAGFSVEPEIASKLTGNPTGVCENWGIVQSPVGSVSRVSEEE